MGTQTQKEKQKEKKERKKKKKFVILLVPIQRPRHRLPLSNHPKSQGVRALWRYYNDVMLIWMLLLKHLIMSLLIRMLIHRKEGKKRLNFMGNERFAVINS